MQFRPLLQCKKNWNFSPMGVWSDPLPALCWGSELLTAFDRDPLVSHQAVDLKDSQSSPLQVVKACYPDLTLPELARLWKLVKNDPDWQKDISQFGNIYGYRWTRDFEKTLDRIVLTPLPFQHWCSQKRVGPQDLAPLRSMTQLNILGPALLTLGKSSLSKSTGILIIEWVVDLILLGTPVEAIMPPTETAVQSWVTQLRSIRFPHSSNQEDLIRQRLRELPWPSRIQGQWLRQGDLSFLEIKVQSHSQNELHQKIEELMEIERKIDQQGVLWNR